MDSNFNNLFSLACNTKIDGIILSGNELTKAKEIEISKNYKLIKICPGIRFKDEIKNNKIEDQKRVMSPENAFKNGADYLVMGRSITQSDDLSARISELNNLII